MGQIPTTDNPTVGVVDSVLRGLVNTCVTALEALIITYVPFLGLPVLKQIFDFFISKIGDFFYTTIALDGTYLVLRFQTAIEKTVYTNAVADLKAAQLSGNPLELQAARLAFNDAASSLIHSDGSHKP